MTEEHVNGAPSKELVPTFKYPALLVCPPSKFEERIANNVWMTDYSEEDLKPDYNRAMTQFVDYYRRLASRALVYVLPAPDDVKLQDLVFTANLGIVLSHLKDRKVAIVSNFTSEPRRGETEYGVNFFKSMGYETFVPETKFEGEADLKYLYDNIYIGGYGMRSELATYKWMEKTFDMKIICVEVTEDRLYHLDCSIFPMAPKKVLICKELYRRKELRELEEVAELIDVDYELAEYGACNNLRVGDTIFNARTLPPDETEQEYIDGEARKNAFLEKVAAENGLKVEFIELDEFGKSGALLSCMVLHMNRDGFSA